MCNTLQLSEMQTPHYSVKWTDFAVPLVPGLYKIHSIMRTLGGLSHKIVRHCWLIYQLDIIITLLCIVLMILSCHRTARESSGTRQVALNGRSMHCQRLPKIYRKLPKSGHLFTQDTLDGTNGVRITEVPLYFNLLCCSRKTDTLNVSTLSWS